MKFFASLAVVLSLLAATPTRAALRVAGASSQSTDGPLVLINETLTLSLRGDEWATARWVVLTAGTGAITTEYTIDGTNWLASAYSKLISTVAANPSVAPWANNTPVAGTYETPLPGNCVAFRIRYQTAGTSTVINLSGGTPYVPGVPVTAVLFDVTSGVNTDNPTGTLDLSGWASVSGEFSSGGATTVALTYQRVPSNGVVISPAQTVVAAATGGTAILGRGTAGTTGSLTQRGSFDVGPVAAQATRLRVEASR